MSPDIKLMLIQVGPIIVLGALFFSALIFSMKRRAARFMDAVGATGLEQPRRVWWSGAIRGTWQGFNAEFRHMARYKGVPERVQLTIGAVAPARIIIKKRTGGFLNKPLTLFGPPLVAPMRFEAREQYWFRAEQAMVLETLLSQTDMAAALEANLIAGFDELDISTRRVKILRAIDAAVVREHYGLPRLSWRSNLEYAGSIVREEWRLAEAVVASGVVRRAE